MTQAKRFADLLSDAIRTISAAEGIRISVLQDELGFKLGRGGGSVIERWRKGHLPPTEEDIAELARLLVHRAKGRLDRAWLTSFLTSSNYRDRDALIEELFPETADAADDPPLDGTSPFKGLQHYDVDDAGLFFGREMWITLLVNRLTAILEDAGGRHRFLAVVGASGVGKSSLVRAGLVAALRTGPAPNRAELPPGSPAWHYHIIVPTANPLAALAHELTHTCCPEEYEPLLAALRYSPHAMARHVRNCMPGAGAYRLLVVDQFEELFTQCEDEATRRAFVDNILTAAEPGGGDVIVVITLRADFYQHCGDFAVLRKLLAGQQVYLGAMQPVELRRAIVEPAQRSGWVFEDRLVDRILDDAAAEPGALPFLSHTLHETWQRRRGRMLTHVGYHEAGTVMGALARSADSVYAQFSTPEQLVARNIFLRLAELGEGHESTRHRVDRSSLAASPAESALVVDVLQHLIDARLLTADEETVQIAHEALVRGWPKLQQWLESNRESLTIHRQLTKSVQAWHQFDRDAGSLYRGAQLAQALEWAEEHGDRLNQWEREFLAQSQERVEAERRREIDQAERLALAAQRHASDQERLSDQFRRWLMAAIVMAVVMLAVAVMAGLNGRKANQQARLAQVRQLTSEARVQLASDPERSALLALHALTQALELEEPAAVPPLEDVLHQAAQSVHIEYVVAAHVDEVTGIAFMPDSAHFFTTGLDATVKLWAMGSDEPLAVMRAHAAPVSALALAADGSRMVTGDESGRVIVWEVKGGAVPMLMPETDFMAHEKAVNSVALSPDGQWLATGSADTTARLWQVADRRLQRTFAGHEAAVVDVDFSVDGTRIVTAGEDNMAHTWDVATGAPLIALVGHTGPVASAAFAPDGQHVATTSWDGTLRLWDAATGTPHLAYKGHNGVVDTLAFSADGQRFITGSHDTTAIIWRPDATDEVVRLEGHPRGITSAAFRPDGEIVVTGSFDGTIRIWHARPRGEHNLFLGPPEGYFDVAYSPDGRSVAAASWAGVVDVWDLTGDRAEPMRLQEHQGRVLDVAYSPDGSRLAGSGDDGQTVIWDSATGVVVKKLLRPQGVVGDDFFNGTIGAAFSPDGRYLAAASADGVVTLWDWQNGTVARELRGHEAQAYDVAFSPDGSRLASVDVSGVAFIWHVETGAIEFPLREHEAPIFGLAYSPDGSRLVTGSRDTTAIVWDTADGRMLARLSGHPGGIAAVAFSPDGRRLVTAGSGGVARVWDGTTFDYLLTLTGPEQVILGAAFSADSRRLILASLDGTVREYAMVLDDLVAVVHSLLSRSFTAEECRIYLHVPTCP